jgi:hypothetical protein
MSRKTSRPLTFVVVLALAVAGIIASGAVAAKPSSNSPTLDVSFPTLASASTTTGTSVPYNTPYVVSGCGYATTVGVTVVVHTPEAISFAGQMPDTTTGCISVSNFSTQGAGHYEVDAYQQLRNKSSRVATMSFDLS